MTPSHIIVAMSGGVDSSVAAFLLKQAGHQVSGMFMKNWEEDDKETVCPAREELADAQSVCDVLGIELHTVNFAEQYWEHVFSHFLSEYRAGRTPNPDILCNKEIKFKTFLDHARRRGAKFIATGHYVRSHHEHLHLRKGLDSQKDQSYFLHALNKEQLSQSMFPIGELTKQEVRTLAKKIGFHNHAKKDSTGICFIGERRFKEFLKNYLPVSPGEIETIDGKPIGMHEGLMFYTIGQRQGLKIGGLKGHAELPWYVVDKDFNRNILIVSQGHNHPALYKTVLFATDLHWINGTPSFPFKAHAKTRYRQEDQRCFIEQVNNRDVGVQFEVPQRAITPGQSVVFYEGDICLGGGIIVNAIY